MYIAIENAIYRRCVKIALDLAKHAIFEDLPPPVNNVFFLEYDKACLSSASSFLLT